MQGEVLKLVTDVHSREIHQESPEENSLPVSILHSNFIALVVWSIKPLPDDSNPRPCHIGIYLAGQCSIQQLNDLLSFADKIKGAHHQLVTASSPESLLHALKQAVLTHHCDFSFMVAAEQLSKYWSRFFSHDLGKLGYDLGCQLVLSSHKEICKDFLGNGNPPRYLLLPHTQTRNHLMGIFAALLGLLAPSQIYPVDADDVLNALDTPPKPIHILFSQWDGHRFQFDKATVHLLEYAGSALICLPHGSSLRHTITMLASLREHLPPTIHMSVMCPYGLYQQHDPNHSPQKVPPPHITIFLTQKMYQPDGDNMTPSHTF